jgi:hypothetical protein
MPRQDWLRKTAACSLSIRLEGPSRAGRFSLASRGIVRVGQAQ